MTCLPLAHWLILSDPLDQWTFVIAALAAVCCAIPGYFLVLRGISLLGDGISHAVLPGLVLAYLFFASVSLPAMYIGAALAGLGVAWFTQALAQTERVSEDAGLGIVFTTFFAAGLVLLQWFAGRAHIDANCVLFGLLDTAALDTRAWGGLEVPISVLRLAPSALLLMGFTWLFWKELKLAAFDPQFSAALGLYPQRLHLGLLVVTALVCVLCFEAVGSILVVAMLVAPATAGMQMSRRMTWQLVWSIGFALLAAYLGTCLASRWSLNSAGMMSVVAALLFIPAALLPPQTGLFASVFRTGRLRLQTASEDVLTRLYRHQERGLQAVPASQLQSELGFKRFTWLILWLQWRGNLRRQGAALALTPHGQSQAIQMIRNHRLWELYLQENFHLPPDHLHDAAERFEHFIGPELQSELEKQLASPQADPHGREIPVR